VTRLRQPVREPRRAEQLLLEPLAHRRREVARDRGEQPLVLADHGEVPVEIAVDGSLDVGEQVVERGVHRLIGLCARSEAGLLEILAQGPQQGRAGGGVRLARIHPLHDAARAGSSAAGSSASSLSVT